MRGRALCLAIIRRTTIFLKVRRLAHTRGKPARPLFVVLRLTRQMHGQTHLTEIVLLETRSGVRKNLPVHQQYGVRWILTGSENQTTIMKILASRDYDEHCIHISSLQACLWSSFISQLYNIYLFTTSPTTHYGIALCSSDSLFVRIVPSLHVLPSIVQYKFSCLRMHAVRVMQWNQSSTSAVNSELTSSVISAPSSWYVSKYVQRGLVRLRQ